MRSATLTGVLSGDVDLTGTGIDFAKALTSEATLVSERHGHQLEQLNRRLRRNVRGAQSRFLDLCLRPGRTVLDDHVRRHDAHVLVRRNRSIVRTATGSGRR